MKGCNLYSFKLGVLFLGIAIFLHLGAFAGKKTLYSRAKIYLDTAQHSMQELQKLGVAVDHGSLKKGYYFIADYSTPDIKLIRQHGFKVKILIRDVSKHYAQQNKKPAK
jgi:hypothetical protein